MSSSYFEMSQKVSKTEKTVRIKRINELRSSKCTPEADFMISESLKKINFLVPDGVEITDWGAVDRIQKLVYIARNQDDIPKLRQALDDLERVVKRQVDELESSPLVVLDWDDGHELLTTIASRLGLNKD